MHYTPPKFPEPLMSLGRVAATVGVHPRTVLRWQAAGMFPHGLKAGRSWRWSQAAVRQWMDARSKEATGETRA